MIYRYLESPFGTIVIAGDGRSLAWLSFTRGSRAVTPPDWTADESDELLQNVSDQLDEYFNGQRERFDLPLGANGTAFQKRVWRALDTIPYGTTVCYSELAERIGRPKAVRAVGAANGQNPISIIIPCHRLLGKNGHLTGYGGGIETKRALLELEARKRAS